MQASMPDTNEKRSIERSIEEVRDEIRHKLAWIHRTIGRMRRANRTRSVADDRRVEIQDDFWTFLHASRLVFNYYQTWSGLTRKRAIRFTARWAETLDPNDQDVWTALHELRDGEVHVRPVAVDGIAEGVVVDGEDVVVDGCDRVVITRYVVEHEGKEIEVHRFCATAVGLLERFANEFDRFE